MTLSTRAEQAKPDEARWLLTELVNAVDVSDSWDRERWRVWFQLCDSIDTPEAHLAAAMMLVPEGWRVSNMLEYESGGWAVYLAMRESPLTTVGCPAKIGSPGAATPALALIAAIARSLGQ